MLVTRPLRIYTEIWDSTAAYKNGLKYECEIFPKLKKKLYSMQIFSADATIFSNKI